MGAKKPRIVVVGAGMAGLTAANRLYTGSTDAPFDLVVVEGGPRIGGRISTSEFGGNRVEMGATWIHGIGGSPVYGIAREIGALESDQPWECMDGFMDGPRTVTEGGREVSPGVVEPVSALFRCLMGFAVKPRDGCPNPKEKEYYDIAAAALEACESSNGKAGGISIGSFLRKGLDIYFESHSADEATRAAEEAIFAMHENTQRTYTSAGDLSRLDFRAESEYRMFPGEEVTIARGYSSVIEHLASALPPGMIQLGRKVSRIQWNLETPRSSLGNGNGHCNGAGDGPVKVHFSDGSTMSADHVIVTVSLGVLKAGISEGSGLFSPPLPESKREAISRLGFGVVNKLFLQLGPSHHSEKFPFLQLAFHPPDSELRHPKVPRWMRRTASLCPIHKNSDIVLSWFAGDEALELEKLGNDDIIDGVSTTVKCSLPEPGLKSSSNGSISNGSSIEFANVLKSKWASDPLFLGSYSYVQVGSSGDDLDALAEPIPAPGHNKHDPDLQILFAGEATHRTHYSTTHGAYFSGLREANRLLKHYHCG